MHARIAVKKMAGNHAKVFDDGKRIIDRDVIYFIGKITESDTPEYRGKKGIVEVHDSGGEIRFFVDNQFVKLRVNKPHLVFVFSGRTKAVVVDDSK